MRTIFTGKSIGKQGTSGGEICFNTGMTGYQEILTDPSYAKQIVTLTYPHIGNTGVNQEDNESNRVWASGLVIRNLPLLASNWRCEQTLDEFLKQQKITDAVAIKNKYMGDATIDQGSFEIPACLDRNRLVHDMGALRIRFAQKIGCWAKTQNDEPN